MDAATASRLNSTPRQIKIAPIMSRARDHRFSAIRSLRPQVIPFLLVYSFRRATTGSTQEARCAGTKQANAATARRMRDTRVAVGA